MLLYSQPGTSIKYHWLSSILINKGCQYVESWRHGGRDSAAFHLSLRLLQLGYLLLQPLKLRPQLLLPLTGPLGLVPRTLQLGLQTLQLQVRQRVQTAGALQRWPAAF